MFGMSVVHWVIVLVIVVVLFGPKRLPELGQSLGEGIRNFRKGLNEPPPSKPETLPEKKDNE